MANYVTDILSNGSQEAFRLEQWGANNEVLGHVYAIYEKGRLTQIDENDLFRDGFRIESSLYDLSQGWRQSRAEAGAHGNNGQVWQEACNLVGNSYALSGGIGETFHKLQHNSRQREAGLKEPIRIQGLSGYVAADEYGQRCTYIEAPSFKEPGGVATFKLVQTRNTVVRAEKVTGSCIPEAEKRDYRDVDGLLSLLEPAGGYPPGANVLSPIVAAITDMLDQTAPDASTQDLLAYGTLERYLRNLSLPNNRPLSGLDQHWVKEKTGINLNKLEGVAGQAVDVADKAWKGISKVLESGTSPLLEFVGSNPLFAVVLGGGMAYQAGKFMNIDVMKNPLTAIIGIALGTSVVHGFMKMLTETGSNVRKEAGNCVKSMSDCLTNNVASPNQLAMQEVYSTV